MCDILHALYQNTVYFLPKRWAAQNHKPFSALFIASCRVYRMTTFHHEKIYQADTNTYSGYIFPITRCGVWYGAFIIIQDKIVQRADELYAAEAFAQLLSRQQHP